MRDRRNRTHCRHPGVYRFGCSPPLAQDKVALPSRCSRIRSIMQRARPPPPDRVAFRWTRLSPSRRARCGVHTAFRSKGTPPSGEENGAASRLRQWFSEKRKSCYASFCRPASYPSRRRPRARVSGRRSGREIWRKEKWPLAALQAADFPENGQRILWKCLEKKAQNLEMFGVDLEKRAEPEVRRREEASRRARSPRLGLR